MDIFSHVLEILTAGAIVFLMVWVVKVVLGVVLRRGACETEQRSERQLEAINDLPFDDAKRLASKVLESRFVTAAGAESKTMDSSSLAPAMRRFLAEWKSVEFGAGAAVVGQDHVRQRDDGLVEIGFSEDGDRFCAGPNDETVFSSIGNRAEIERYAASIFHLVLVLDAVFSENPVWSPRNA